MNRIALTLLATTAALAATSARADTRISFGLNLGLPTYHVAAPAVVCAPPPTVVYAPVTPVGYWKEVVVKTWVPERWVSGRDRWGRSVRVCEPGYYSCRNDRVWVAPEGPINGHNHGRYGWNH